MSSRKDEHLPALAGNTVPFLRMPVLLRLRYRFRKALSALLPSRAPRRYLYTEIIESDKGADRIPVRRAYSMNLKALMADFSADDLARMAERGDAPPPQLTVTFSAYFRSGAVISGATGICADEATGAALGSTVRPALHLLHGRAEPPAEKLRPLRGDEHTFYIPPPPPARSEADRFRLFFCEYLPELHLCLTEALRKDTPACLVMRDDAAPYEEDVYAALALKFPALSFLRLKDSEALHAPKALLPCYRTKGKAEPYLSRGYRNFLNDLLTSHFRMPPAPRRIGGQSGPRARPVRVFLRFEERDDVPPPNVTPALPKARPYCLKEMRLSDVVALMRRTVHLQAPHGAALAAALFLPEGARVTEILDAQGGGCAYWWMCKVFGLRYDTARVEEDADLTANLWSAGDDEAATEAAPAVPAPALATPEPERLTAAAESVSDAAAKQEASLGLSAPEADKTAVITSDETPATADDEATKDGAAAESNAAPAPHPASASTENGADAETNTPPSLGAPNTETDTKAEQLRPAQTPVEPTEQADPLPAPAAASADAPVSGTPAEPRVTDAFPPAFTFPADPVDSVPPAAAQAEAPETAAGPNGDASPSPLVINADAARS